MIEDDATHLRIATDHVIESFRNQLWPGYKTGAGIEPALQGNSIHSKKRGVSRWAIHRPTRYRVVVQTSSRATVWWYTPHLRHRVPHRHDGLFRRAFMPVLPFFFN